MAELFKFIRNNFNLALSKLYLSGQIMLQVLTLIYQREIYRMCVVQIIKNINQNQTFCKYLFIICIEKQVYHIL